MKKVVVTSILFLMYLSVFSQIVDIAVSGNPGTYKIYTEYKSNGIDYLVVLNGIDNTTQIEYTGTVGTTTSINWYKFSAPTNSISNQTYISPEDATGYICNIDGKEITIWVIDYSKYVPAVSSFAPEEKPTEQCTELNLLLNANVPELSYYNRSNTKFTIERKFSLAYKSLTWGGSAWTSKDVNNSVTLPASVINVAEAPLCNTYFTLTGDQIAEDLGISNEFKTPLYNAVAVSCKVMTETTTRDEKNEGDRPSAITTLTGSAPLDIFFKSNGTNAVTGYYWTITKDKSLIASRNTADHRFTFTEPAKYVVKVVVSNSYCSFADSVEVEVSESALVMPRAFTPNSDGTNDEFRATYRSLKTFHCWIYNRWGRMLYSWSDPQKGWDGKINGKKAAEGPYFYVVKAMGTDNIRYYRRGTFSLLRGGND